MVVAFNTNSIENPKPYELDWNKVKTIEDIVLLLKLIHATTDKQVYLNLMDAQVEAYKHLFKENTDESIQD